MKGNRNKARVCVQAKHERFGNLDQKISDKHIRVRLAEQSRGDGSSYMIERHQLRLGIHAI